MIQWLEKLLEAGGMKKDIALLLIGATAVALSLAGIEPLPFEIVWVAVVVCGTPIILEALIGLITEFDIKADVLVSMALIASLAIGETFAAGEVAFIMQLGALLEEFTVARARAGIERLVKLTPQTARVVENGKENVIDAKDVAVGQLIRVLPGETVPADGVIVSGTTCVNEAVMTGEPVPVDKKEGDSVSSGTVNQFGAFTMRAEKVGSDSSIGRMIRLVQSADAGKAKIVRLADRWATWIVVGALSTAAVTWAVTGEIIRAVTVLVVFCPCALVLATPTAIMAAIGNATRHGMLVREGDALERLAAVKGAVFDKTGTLTYGTPRVCAVKSLLPGLTDTELFTLTASVEQLSEHPLGKAVASSLKAHGNGMLLPVEKFEMIPGQGVRGIAQGKELLAGNRALLSSHGIAIEETAQMRELTQRGNTLVLVAVDGVLAGFIALTDEARAESARTIGQITALGVRPILLTGDNEAAARRVAGELGIAAVKAHCRPEDKLAFIEAEEKAGRPVCMVGDGINDAAALKRARVGVAMGDVGSDIAVDASDIVLVKDDIRELPHLIALARHTMNVIRLNMTFSMVLNFVAVILAVLGILNPFVGALVHNGGSVLVITNSAFLLHWRKRK